MNWLIYETIFATEKIMSSVFEFCTTSPLSKRSRRCGSEPICRALPIAPLIYHDHEAKRRALPAAARSQRDAALKVEVRRVFEEDFRVYGVRKVWRRNRKIYGCQRKVCE